MSHKRKRKNSHSNNDLPSPKRLKSEHNDNKKASQSTFPFEKAKPCDKIIPLAKGKKNRLKLKLREQSIRIQQKAKEIDSLQSRLKNSYKTYGHYHRLLITFANTFDAIFVQLQQKINSNHALPLLQKTMEMLVRGIRVKSDKKHKYNKHRNSNNNSHSSESDSDSDQDMDIHDIQQHHKDAMKYPLNQQLEQIDAMLQQRTQSVTRFLDYIGAQLQESNDINLKLYLDAIKKQMDDYGNVAKKISTKYDAQHILHEQQLLLEENWDLSVHYNSLLRHYKYITDHSKFVKTDTHSHNVANGFIKDKHHKTEDVDYANNGNNKPKTIKKESQHEDHHKHKSVIKSEEEHSEEIERMKKEMEHLRDKYATQKNEIYNFQDKICEHEKTISNLKGRNENFLRQINEQNTMEQCDDLEKGFLKHMNEFSSILQEEYRQSLQTQCEDREKALKQQIEELNIALSDTKNKLFQIQVKTVKKRKTKHSHHKTSGDKESKTKHKDKESKSSSKRDKNKDKEDRKRSKRSKDKKDKEHKDKEKASSKRKDKEKDKEKTSSSSSSSKMKDKEKENKKDKRSVSRSSSAGRSRSRNRNNTTRSVSKSPSKSRSRSRSRSRTKHNKSSKRDKDKKQNHSSSSRKSKSLKSSSSRRSNTEDVDKKINNNNKYEEDSDYDNDHINEKNQICMESVKDYVFKQLQQEIKRNQDMQRIIDGYKMKESDTKKPMDVDSEEEDKVTQLTKTCEEYLQRINTLESSTNNNSNNSNISSVMKENTTLKRRIDELTKQTKKNNKLNMKLQILKQEVNKSQKQIKESNDEKDRHKLLWNEEIVKLKEQNDLLVSSNHKNRAELKRMNEERKLLSVKFDLHKNQEEIYKKQIAEKENENHILTKKEEDTIREFKIAQQSNNTLKEMSKKLYQQLQGLKCDLKSRCDDYTEKAKKYQDLTKKYQAILDEKKDLNSKVKTLRSSLIKYENIENDNSHNHGANGDINVQTLQYLLKEKKQKLTCAVCTEREKQVLLSKCLHMFCKICIQQQQTARNRSCPLCKTKFDPNSDVKPVTF